MTTSENTMSMEDDVPGGMVHPTVQPVAPKEFHVWANKHSSKFLILAIVGLSLTIVMYLVLTNDKTMENTDKGKRAYIVSIVSLIVFGSIGLIFSVTGLMSAN